MITAKPFKTIPEQIAILKQRKMAFPDENFAKKVLSYENYYYVVNGYKEPFINSTNPEDSYKPGTTFNELVALYSFDRRLRELLLIELLRIASSISFSNASRINCLFDFPANSAACFSLSLNPLGAVNLI